MYGIPWRILFSFLFIQGFHRLGKTGKTIVRKKSGNICFFTKSGENIFRWLVNTIKFDRSIITSRRGSRGGGKGALPPPPFSESLGIDIYSGFRKGVQFEILRNPCIDSYSGFRKTTDLCATLKILPPPPPIAKSWIRPWRAIDNLLWSMPMKNLMHVIHCHATVVISSYASCSFNIMMGHASLWVCR